MNFQIIYSIFNNLKFYESSLGNYFKSSIALSSNSIIVYTRDVEYQWNKWF